MNSGSFSSRHRALLGALLVFCIGSLLTLSFRPLSVDRTNDWVVSSRPRFPSPNSNLGGKNDDESVGTGAPGTDLENNNKLDSSIDPDSLSLDALKRSIKSTILDTAEDLSDPTRSIRPNRGSKGQLGIKVDDLNSDPSMDDEVNADDELAEDEMADDGDGDEDVDDSDQQNQASEEDAEDSMKYSEDDMDDQEEPPNTESPDLSQEHEDNGDDDNDDDDHASLDLDLEKPEGQEADKDSSASILLEDTTLADFDVNSVLSPSESYLLFIPSGETIEAQFFSLLTSLWIAKHSNRTLIIPPPMMAPPSLHEMYPYFAGPRGTKRQRWSNLFDLGPISRSQRTVQIDNTRPVLQTPFTAAMAQEEETPKTTEQAIPYVSPDQPLHPDPTAAKTTMTPVKIKCHGPPTAGSWGALDFAGRHFLNRYNLVAEFEMLDDPYWSLKPEAIQRHWRASTAAPGEMDIISGGSLPQHRQRIDDRHRQLVCISGAELVGTEDPVMEELIWQELGSHIPFSQAIIQQGRQSILQVLRALERSDRRNGYIGVHIDRLPSREFCRHGVEGSTSSPNRESSQPLNNENPGAQASESNGKVVNGGERRDLDIMAVGPLSSTVSPSGMTPTQCLWTADLIARRIAIIQKSEHIPSRPVVVTTTETDPEILAKMDRQHGWLRVGSEDDGNGLFGTDDEQGGYGPAVSRAYVMANSAIFVGSRSSALGVHAAFRMKNEGRLKTVPPMWELY